MIDLVISSDTVHKAATAQIGYVAHTYQFWIFRQRNRRRIVVVGDVYA